MNFLKFSNTQWQAVIQDASVAVIQASGLNIEMAYGSVPPAADVSGFLIPSGIPLSVPHIADLGGRLFVRSRTGEGAVRYVSA